MRTILALTWVAVSLALVSQSVVAALFGWADADTANAAAAIAGPVIAAAGVVAGFYFRP